jgi:hypothetical protein
MDKVSDTPRTDRVQKFTPIGSVWLNHAKNLERELAALKEQYRVLEDELLVLGDERNEAVAALQVAVGLLSTMPQFSNMHPNDVLEGILKETKEMK